MMGDEKLAEIMLELNFIGTYIQILRDYCEYKGNSREMCIMLPLLKYICKEFKRVYNELDDFDREMFSMI